MAVERWLIDKSAYARLATSPDKHLWAERMSRGLLNLSSVTLLEIGYSFRNGDEARHELAHPPLAALDIEYLSPKIERRAFEVQLALVDDSQHRGISLPDLLVAATAELTGRTVLHVDSDFDRIAHYTGQTVERLSLGQ